MRRVNFFSLLLVSIALSLVSLFAATQPLAGTSGFVLATPNGLHNHCSDQLAFTPHPISGPAAITVKNGQISFLSNGFVSTTLCQSGNLTITAKGQLGGDELPKLIIQSGDQILSSPTFSDRKTVNVHLSQPGRLTLGYFNDYYRAELRLLTLSGFKLESTSCQTITFDVPAMTGGGYQAYSNTATLIYQFPMTLVPCAAGKLTFTATGQSAGGHYPAFELSQNQQVIQTFTSSSARQKVQVELDASPLSIKVTNPYAKQVADRNLLVYSVKFVPTNSNGVP